MFDEMENADSIRSQYKQIARWIETEGIEALRQRRGEAEALFRKVGITFAVYGEGGDAERLIPFDMIPRIFSKHEWDVIDTGCRQRARALNAFLGDIYGAQEILKAGHIPRALIEQNLGFERAMIGVQPPGGVWAHICGIDIVRTGPDDFMVLEDNCRTPSGVSYMLESREVMMQMFPALFSDGHVRNIDDYPDILADAMVSLAPPRCEGEPNLAILTPGYYNSAYYEHSFLADRMGVELVEGQDLYCEDGRVYMRTIHGPERVDVLYRRIDDAYLDPKVFNPDSILGVPGLMEAYRQGGVTLFNAPGTGIADDKAVYAYVPKMIEFYLGEKPILKNVHTYHCDNPDDLGYVLENLELLVVKEVNGSGGYGMLVGPRSSATQRSAFAQKLKTNPSNYIAQPTLDLSTVPIITENGISPRHVDLRPFVITGHGNTPRLAPGGLTRVALNEGSLVVNSSQGGGVKDTWVLRQ